MEYSENFRRARDLKQSGNLEEAESLLLLLTRSFPEEPATYHSLGKVAYLNSRAELSKRSYLTAAHLTVSATTEDDSVAEQYMAMIEFVPEEQRLQCSRVHRSAPKLLAYNGLVHLGHTISDLCDGVPLADTAHIALYRQSIQRGVRQSDPLLDASIEDRYRALGLSGALGSIFWLKLGTPPKDVGAIYGF